ncbi:hypothetical protein D3C73_1167470 [compost metagenome]
MKISYRALKTIAVTLTKNLMKLLIFSVMIVKRKTSPKLMLPKTHQLHKQLTFSSNTPFALVPAISILNHGKILSRSATASTAS